MEPPDKPWVFWAPGYNSPAMTANAVKVALIKCNSYDRTAVRTAIAQAVDLLGGIERFISPEQNVLIKPNMLSPQPPEKAVTTHPSVVEAVIELVQSAGAHPVVGDSPGFYKFYRVASISGIEDAVRKTGARLVPFEYAVAIDTAEGCLMKKIEVAREVVEADAVISVSKFKTHCLTYISGAIKNLFGCIPGLRKSEMHYRFPDNERFSRMLVDVALSLPIRLHVVDAVIGMDGNGPSSGDPFHMGLIIAGVDPVAVDSTACRIAGIDPREIPMIRIGAELSLGVSDGEAIEIVGEDFESIKVRGFRAIPPHAKTGHLIPLPRFLSNRFRDWIVNRPRFMHDRCTRCGACTTICPARPKALTLRDGRVMINDRLCVLCYCCYEVCPSNAIALKRGFAAALLARLLKIE
jgi:uncharacterized protein (DUF362 family)/Pyruvate/2-oxoacid:ferredoxin oxidoreductase delta subunit